MQERLSWGSKQLTSSVTSTHYTNSSQADPSSRHWTSCSSSTSYTNSYSSGIKEIKQQVGGSSTTAVIVINALSNPSFSVVDFSLASVPLRPVPSLTSPPQPLSNSLQQNLGGDINRVQIFHSGSFKSLPEFKWDESNQPNLDLSFCYIYYVSIQLFIFQNYQ